jgi:hypothetical protein
VKNAVYACTVVLELRDDEKGMLKRTQRRFRNIEEAAKFYDAVNARAGGELERTELGAGSEHPAAAKVDR